MKYLRADATCWYFRCAGRPSRRLAAGLTLVELLVVVTIMGTLAAIILPALGAARRAASRVSCVSNLKNIAIGFQLYTMSYNGAFPAAQDPVSTDPYYWLWMGRGWRGFLLPYLGHSVQVLYCPSDRTAPAKWESTSYGYSLAFYHAPAQINAMTDSSDTYLNPQPPLVQFVDSVEFPSSKVLIAEWLSNHKKTQGDESWWCWEGSRNLLFVDGHVEFRAAGDIHPANDGFPDFNLTVDGIRGRDVD